MWNLFPEQASSLSPLTDRLMIYVLCVSLFFALAIAGAIIFLSAKYHYRTQADRSNPPAYNLALEILWTAIPLGFVLTVFVWGAYVYIRLHRPPANAEEIYVIGKQWMWKLQHPEGPREINELHVPVGKPVRLLMTSQDVIHSFFIPAFRVKQDVLPGRYTSLWFQADRPGRYHLFCSQYCGTSHSGMIGWVDVMNPADYQKWLSGAQVGAASAGPETIAAGAENDQATTSEPEVLAGMSMPEAGGQLFRRLGCVTCHRGGTSTGPSLSNVFNSRVTLANGQTVTADETYLRESILRPQAKVVRGYNPVMPTFRGQVTEEQLQQLIAYIKSMQKRP